MGGFAAVLYRGVAYLLFLGTLLYAVAFVGNLPVPKTIDGGDAGLTLVAAGMGICFLPEFSNTIPGVISRPVIQPSIEREVCLVTVAGRRWSSPVAAFVRAVQQYKWPEAAQASDRELTSSLTTV